MAVAGAWKERMGAFQLSGRALFGGFSLLVFMILLSGGVYSAVEGWDFLNGVYFAMVTISTIGYGDKYPTTTAGKLLNVVFIWLSFCGFFVLLRLLISYMVDENLNKIVAAIKERRRELRAKAKEKGLLMAPLHIGQNGDMDSQKALSDAQRELAKAGDSALSNEETIGRKAIVTGTYALVYVLWLIVWAVFFSAKKSENDEFNNFWKALYFGIITSSTIGYGGAQVPQSAGGKLFATMFLLIGVLSFTVFAGHLSDRVLTVILQIMEKRMKRKDDESSGKKRKRARYMLNRMLLDAHQGKAIDRCDYVTNMLVAAGRVTREEVVDLMQQFDDADSDGNGSLDLMEIQTLKTTSDLFRLGTLRDASSAGDFKDTLIAAAAGKQVVGLDAVSEDGTIDSESDQ